MSFEKLSSETLRRHKGKSFVGVSTATVIFNPKGQIFLAQRSVNSRDEHGRWDVCGGGLKWGMHIEENMRRELEEEFAIESTQPLQFFGIREVFRTDQHGDATHWVCFDHILVLTDDEAKNVRINEPDKFDDCGWFDLDNLPSPLHSAATPDLIDKLKLKFAEVTN